MASDSGGAATTPRARHPEMQRTHRWNESRWRAEEELSNFRMVSGTETMVLNENFVPEVIRGESFLQGILNFRIGHFKIWEGGMSPNRNV